MFWEEGVEGMSRVILFFFFYGICDIRMLKHDAGSFQIVARFKQPPTLTASLRSLKSRRLDCHNEGKRELSLEFGVSG